MIELAKTCPECKGEIIFKEDEQICVKCGLVVEENKVSSEPDWNVYNEPEKRHVGNPINFSLHDKGLSTIIGRENFDYNGSKIPQNTQNNMMRLRRIQRHTICNDERTLAKGFGLIYLNSDKLMLPYSTRERASLIFRLIAEKGLIKGRTITTIVAATLYAACRETQIIRSLKDISKITNTTKKEIYRNYGLILKNNILEKPKNYSYVKYITKIGEALQITGEQQGEAIKLLIKIQQNSLHLNGKDPKGLATSALYIISQKYSSNTKIQITQVDLAAQANITEVTIRNRCKDLKRVLLHIEKTI